MSRLNRLVTSKGSVFVEVPLANLFVDGTYQRIENFDNARARRIAADFDWMCCSPLKVVERRNGKMAVIDGQYRRAAMIEKFGLGCRNRQGLHCCRGGQVIRPMQFQCKVPVRLSTFQGKSCRRGKKCKSGGQNSSAVRHFGCLRQRSNVSECHSVTCCFLRCPETGSGQV